MEILESILMLLLLIFTLSLNWEESQWRNGLHILKNTKELWKLIWDAVESNIIQESWDQSVPLGD